MGYRLFSCYTYHTYKQGIASPLDSSNNLTIQQFSNPTINHFAYFYGHNIAPS
ncbi:hypothetical protein L1278_002105 [Pontibacter sp. HSC-36F09]|nr:hypothetical protein [Pontibacter sp. HSC-36F09]